MNRKLLTLACLTVIAVAACKPQAPVETTPAADAKTAEVAPPQVAIESEAARMPFDLKGFAGKFNGTLPCADCPGIDTSLTLNTDGTFKLDETYQGKNGKASLDGTWTVEADDKHVRLDPNSKSDADRQYEILSKEELRLLDQEGKHIESDAPHNLKRAP